MSALASRRRRNILIAVAVGIALLILGWTVYWFILAAQLQKGVENWAVTQNEAGLEVGYSSLNVTGYPFRFSLTMKDPQISNPVSGLNWKGEKLNLVAQSYNLQHVIGFAPGESLVGLANGRELKVTPAKKSAISLRFDNDWKPKVVRLSLPGLLVEEDGHTRIDAKSISLSLRPMPDNRNSLQAAFAVEETQISGLPQHFDWLGNDLKEAMIWLEVENFYPLLRGDLTDTEWRVDGNKIRLARGEIIWGPLDLASRADIQLDRDMEPKGTFGIHLERTEELIAALEAAEMIQEQIKPLIRTIGLVSAKNEFTSVEIRDGGIYYFGRRLTEY